jgi:hypothetical protein
MIGPTILVSALTGGLAALGAQWLQRHWVRPILVIVFNRNEIGCRVHTPAVQVGEGTGVGPVAEQLYLRLKIKNEGRTFARNASVCVTRIGFHAHGVGERTFAEEVFDLKLALSGRAVFNLASGGHRFVDLVHATQNGRLAFDFVESPIRLAILGFGSGDYEIDVVATAENATSVSRLIKWSWDGTLHGLTMP